MANGDPPNGPPFPPWHRYEPPPKPAEEPPKLPKPRCDSRACPLCGHHSLVNHCWWMWQNIVVAEVVTHDPAYPGSLRAATGVTCTDVICFVCLSRFDASLERGFVYTREDWPRRQRCCGVADKCDKMKTNGNGLCCP